jgi:hypothetical protein
MYPECFPYQRVRGHANYPGDALVTADRSGRVMVTIPDKYSADFVDRLDKRTAIAKAILGRIEGIESDLGGGDSLSYARRSLVRRVVWLEAIIEHTEQRLAGGEAIDIGAHTQATNTLVGLYKTLGLERRPKPVARLHEHMRAVSS